MKQDVASSQTGPWFDVVSTDGGVALEVLGLSTGARVLDVGTGKGNFAIFLALQGFDVVTGEPSTDGSHYARQGWAENARQAGVEERIRFADFDGAQMPFADGDFDGVFFYGVLHHVDEAQRAAVVREALRVVKPGCWVVLFEPRKERLQMIRVEDPGHPEAADPLAYVDDERAESRRIEGSFMDIFLCRKLG